VVPIHPRPAPEPPDAGSFEDVYRASYARMVRAAHMLTGSREAAEEVVQDAFLRLYPRFDTIQDPTGYLYRSVVNGCRAGHRRRRVRERLRPLPVTNDVGPPEIDETWTALRRLSPRRRAVIVLRFYADLPIADIAQALDCPPGTVKSLLHRSLAQLKDVIDR
jgi:RNA polymerase sigma factor (sigma-70 family)